MKTFHKFIVAALVTASCGALAQQAEAHGIWFAQRATQLALIYGLGADDLDAVKRLPLIKSIEGFDENWKPVPASLRAAGPIPVVDSETPIAAVAAAMDNGVWSKTADGRWLAKGKDEVPQAVASERTMKFAVHLTKPLASALPAIPSQLLQIVPVGTAIPAEMGKPLTVRVLYRGKPVGGATVINDFVNDPDQAGRKSAADGTVTLNLRNQGLNVLGATYVGPSDNPARYERIEYFATLSFVLPHEPE